MDLWIRLNLTENTRTNYSKRAGQLSSASSGLPDEHGGYRGSWFPSGRTGLSVFVGRFLSELISKGVGCQVEMTGDHRCGAWGIPLNYRTQ